MCCGSATGGAGGSHDDLRIRSQRPAPTLLTSRLVPIQFGLRNHFTRRHSNRRAGRDCDRFRPTSTPGRALAKLAKTIGAG